jgi:hypothetical protein
MKLNDAGTMVAHEWLNYPNIFKYPITRICGDPHPFPPHLGFRRGVPLWSPYGNSVIRQMKLNDAGTMVAHEWLNYPNIFKYPITRICGDPHPFPRHFGFRRGVPLWSPFGNSVIRQMKLNDAGTMVAHEWLNYTNMW